MDDEKLKYILYLKEAELVKLEKREGKIRDSITDEDYTAEELVDRDKGTRILPESIIYKLQPIWQTAEKLIIEIRCISEIIRDSEKYAIKNSRMRKD